MPEIKKIITPTFEGRAAVLGIMDEAGVRSTSFSMGNGGVYCYNVGEANLPTVRALQDAVREHQGQVVLGKELTV